MSDFAHLKPLFLAGLIPLASALPAAATGTIEIFGGNAGTLPSNAQIHDGDLTPSIVDGTDWGAQALSIPNITHNFNIENDHSTQSISISGSINSNPADFTVANLPSPTELINPSSSDPFTILFHPSAEGTRTAVINILNSDTGSFTFVVRGVGGIPEIVVEGKASPGAAWQNISDDIPAFVVIGTWPRP